MEFGTDIHGANRMNPNDFGDPLTFPQTEPKSPQLWWNVCMTIKWIAVKFAMHRASLTNSIILTQWPARTHIHKVCLTPLSCLSQFSRPFPAKPILLLSFRPMHSTAAEWSALWRHSKKIQWGNDEAASLSRSAPILNLNPWGTSSASHLMTLINPCLSPCTDPFHPLPQPQSSHCTQPLPNSPSNQPLSSIPSTNQTPPSSYPSRILSLIQTTFVLLYIEYFGFWHFHQPQLHFMFSAS